MNSEIIKDNLRKFYNQEAEYRNSGETQHWKKEKREHFQALIRKEGKQTLLELGAGSGKDSLYFIENGFKVTAVDISSEMVRICKNKGIDAYEMDYYNISSLNRGFDCIWAMNSLLHVPKQDFSMVLREIDKVLNESGLFYMGIYGGTDSEWDFQNDLIDVPRFFASYSRESLIDALSEVFDVDSFEQIDVDRGIDFQSVILRKKK